ncbi:MAG: S8 family serine peptidase [Synergistaceae bacterium]|nr:S8 family serine peptidase [Synergistaceae bacterium]
MKKILILTLFCLLAALPSYAGPRYVEGEAIAAIKMTPAGNVAVGVMSAKTSAAASDSSAAMESGAELIQVFSPIAAGEVRPAVSAKRESSSGSELLALAHFRGAAGETTAQLIARLKENHDVVSAMPNYMMPVSSVKPNDPMWKEQWGSERIKLPEVWEHGTGSQEVVAVVFDTGVIYDHEDLKDNMFVFDEKLLNGIKNNGVSLDVGEFKGSHVVWCHSRGVYADKEGLIHDNGVFPAVPVGPGGGNGIGVAGANWHVKLMAANVFSMYRDEKGIYGVTALISDQMRAIDFIVAAKRAGANIRVANMSLGMWAGPEEEEFSPYEAKVKQLSDAGIIICAAAGNEGQNIDDPHNTEKFDYRGKLSYPACFKVENMISVGDSASGDGCAYYSNYSPSGKWVDIFAPGDNILSTYRGSWIVNPSSDVDTFDPSGYVSISGTSMASPYVAGAAALLCSLYPDKSAAEIRSMLLNGAEYGLLAEGYSKYGMLNVIGAYNYGQPSDGGSSGGGCAAGFGALALIGAALLPFIRRAGKK